MIISPAGNLAALIGRVLLAAIFILSGYMKLKGYMDGSAAAGTAKYMEAAGVPGSLLPLVIAAELGGGLLILIGFQTRLVALALFAFTLAAGILFHFKPADQMQMTQFMKNLAIAGGFLMLFTSGAGTYSADGAMSRRSDI